MIDPSHQSLVEQLRALAAVSKETNEFDIVREEGRTIHVRFRPGTTDSLDVTTRIAEHTPRVTQAGYRHGRREGPLLVPRPMKISLRKETQADRDIKARGVNREAQIGDPEFDAAVYIDTLVDDAVIRAVLASPDTRAAIIALHGDGCHAVCIDDNEGNVSLGLVEFLKPAPDPQRAARLVDALTRLAVSLPPIRASGEAPPTDVQGNAASIGCGLGIVGLVGAFVAAYALAPSHCLKSNGEGSSLVCSAAPACCLPLLGGFGAGIFASLPVVLLLHRLVRGRPSSSTHRFLLQVSAVILLAEIGIVVARLVQ